MSADCFLKMVVAMPSQIGWARKWSKNGRKIVKKWSKNGMGVRDAVEGAAGNGTSQPFQPHEGAQERAPGKDMMPRTPGPPQGLPRTPKDPPRATRTPKDPPRTSQGPPRTPQGPPRASHQPRRPTVAPMALTTAPLQPHSSPHGPHCNPSAAPRLPQWPSSPSGQWVLQPAAAPAGPTAAPLQPHSSPNGPHGSSSEPRCSPTVAPQQPQ